jgi:rhodanese-related sulfurtransferase
MLRRLLNLPFTVASRAARVYQDREDARVRERYGTAADPGDVAIAGRNLDLDVGPEAAALQVEAATARGWVLGRRRVEFVDLRTDAERGDDAGIPGALHMPFDSVQVRVSELSPDLPVVAYCTDGRRSAAAVRFFRDRGMEDTWALRGGLGAWRADEQRNPRGY